MNLFDWMQDNVGLAIVESAQLDYGARRVTMWTGGKAFLEYVVRSDGAFTQSEAWSVAKPPGNLQEAMLAVLDRREAQEYV